MAYSTIADVQQAAGGAKRLLQLSDFDGKNAVDNAIVERAIARADALINVYVHKRYGVDLEAPVPQVVVDLSAEEAVFALKKDRGMLTAEDIELHKERLERLEAIARGQITLGVSPQPAKSELVVDKAIAPTSDIPIRREAFKGFA